MLVTYPSRCPKFWFLLVFFFLLLSVSRLCQIIQAAFASFYRGQPLAWQTKVVDGDLRPLKPDQTRLSVPDCTNDGASPNPTTRGRDVPDDHVHTNCGCVVSICGSVRCKTCKHISQGSTFTSNVTKKSYEVVSSGTSMSCVDDNVVYLITCRKCGIQYVGETSQKLRNRLNNHRSSLKKLPNLYLYHHFSSDGHSEDDISIMPIEKITQDDDRASITSVRLQREDYWCRELCTYYPYGLNDNVRGIGNVSKKPGLVVNELFNRRDRRFRKRNGHRHRKRLDVNDITSRLENCLHEYKSCFFCFSYTYFSP